MWTRSAQAKQTSTLFTYPGGMEGWVDPSAQTKIYKKTPAHTEDIHARPSYRCHTPSPNSKLGFTGFCSQFCFVLQSALELLTRLNWPAAWGQPNLDAGYVPLFSGFWRSVSDFLNADSKCSPQHSPPQNCPRCPCTSHLATDSGSRSSAAQPPTELGDSSICLLYTSDAADE